MNFYDVAVIGGGAAGMACAARLSENKNLKIALIESADRLGKKLARTGNGQGNISNIEMTPSHYHGGGARLAGKIACGDPYELCLIHIYEPTRPRRSWDGGVGF